MTALEIHDNMLVGLVHPQSGFLIQLYCEFVVSDNEPSHLSLLNVPLNDYTWRMGE